MLKLFESNATDFSTNGLGVLKPLKLVEYKSVSIDEWYVVCYLPVNYLNLIEKDRILLVNTKEKGYQAFRISNPYLKRTRIELKAYHIMYDAADYVLDDVRPTNLSSSAFLQWCNDRTDNPSPFNVDASIEGTLTHYFTRKTLFDSFVYAAENFGGYFDVDNYNLTLKSKDSIGSDKGVVISYGKNLEDWTIYEDWDYVVTKMLPVGQDGLLLPEQYLYADIEYKKPYTKVVEFQSDLEEATEEELISELRTKAQQYLDENKVPKVNYKIKSNINQTLVINDIVHVKHPLFSVDTNVISYQYNVITKQVEIIEFGNFKNDLKSWGNAINSNVQKAVEGASTNRELIQVQTNILNQFGKTGYLYRTDNEMYILDALPIEDATKVWRFGLGGIGYSDTGVDGLYKFALTQDGSFNTAFINANTIEANMLNVKGLTVKNGSGVETLSISSEGDLEMNGKIIAENGNIGDWDIVDGELVSTRTLENGSQSTVKVLRPKDMGTYITDAGFSFNVYDALSGEVHVGVFADEQLSVRTSNYDDDTYLAANVLPQRLSLESSNFDKSLLTEFEINILNSGAYSMGHGGVRLEINSADGLSIPLILENGAIDCLNIIPRDSSQDIGSSTERWNTIYLTNSPDVSSDARLKKNFKEVDSSLAFKLKPYWFRLKSDNSLHCGFKAQDVLSVIPEGIVSGNEHDMYSLRYEEIIAINNAAIQSLKSSYDSLLKRVELLERGNK